MDIRDEIVALRERTGATLLDIVRAAALLDGQAIEEDAKAAADEFYQASKRVRDTRPFSEHNRYSLRVEPQNVAPTIQWVRVKFFGPKGAKVRRDQRVRRGEGARYNMAAFKEAVDWELAMIEKLEEVFGPLRTRAGILSRMVQAAHAYQQTVEKAERERREREAFEASLPAP